MLPFTSGELEALLALWLLPFARIAALFSSAPLLSHAAFPARLRLAAAFAITGAVTLVQPAYPLPRGSALILAMVEQVVLGLAVGFTMQLVFAAAQMAGEVIGLQMGIGFASFFDPGGSGESPLPAAFLSVCAFLVFLAIDGHLVLIEAVAGHFRDVPPGRLLASLDVQSLASAGASVFRVALQLAMAPIAGLLIVNLAFGLVARVSPQLNIFTVGFPAMLMAGLALLSLAAPAWVGALEQAMRVALLALR